MDLSVLYESDRLRRTMDKAIRDRFGSQEAAAKAIGIRNSALSRYKRLGNGGRKARKRAPTLRTLMKIRHALGNDVYKAILSAINAEVNKPKKHKK